MYLVKTIKLSGVFRKADFIKKENGKSEFTTKKRKTPSSLKGSAIEIRNNDILPVQIKSVYQYLSLFLMTQTIPGHIYNRIQCVCFPCLRYSSRSLQLKKLYESGQERIEKDFSIDRIIRKVKVMNYYLKKKVWNEENLYEIENCDKNVIELDTGSDNNRT